MTHRWRWIPNALTFLRILLIAPFAAALMAKEYRFALVIFFLASATDAFDGFLARHYNWRTRLGAIADPLADKALLITTYLMLAITGVLPAWLFWLVLGRDLLIVCGGLAFHYGVGRFEMQPSLPGKLNTLIQVLVALAIIILLADLPMQPWVMDVGILLVAASAIFSGAHYIGVWSLRAWRAKRQ
ncbi:CDP-alcohol phosphatidyltransferase [Marinobacter salarius]|jgi:cardiolipin synthase|uniref:CDP-alcohol phosphatidyltransferase family protein n=1 Tax=Marinobacter TaxID=2742 RepID=UPI0012559123|nr:MULTISPECIES: CDP-alcohol phosphatidyltransferase family protein [Marinobacter]MCZ4286709.1 CDP-alcohol phosphatidyltransferase family protein [Marinobacter salarius]MDC8457737.1 CDP-alcohol phosphatidyltransferase family protein [Marinobacter sp. DS40M6]MDM8180654.1 CDP-alcohol phosphatidyltransferase family protein [Marinobacter salarius]VVS96269.1 CDP-alcohol phosphatidyltransferase [Marinobacter salarius]VXC51459.1 CDP-alcohol phosphatidyltransferase [Marinobacter salarius]